MLETAASVMQFEDVLANLNGLLDKAPKQAIEPDGLVADADRSIDKEHGDQNDRVQGSNRIFAAFCVALLF